MVRSSTHLPKVFGFDEEQFDEKGDRCSSRLVGTNQCNLHLSSFGQTKSCWRYSGTFDIYVAVEDDKDS